MLARLQEELEAIYRVESPYRVTDFVLDGDTFRRLRPDATAPEEVLILEEDGELSLAVYIDDAVLGRLEGHDLDDPDPKVIRDALGPWSVALEGVSHFTYLVARAERGGAASLLELEAQAEVDKYVAALLYCWRRGRKQASPELRRRLFGRVRFRGDLDAGTRDRYRTANALAARYARRLERRYLGHGAPEGLLREVRGLYRLGAAEKLGRMRAA